MIILPLPPSVNALYGGGSKQRRFKSAGYKNWLERCPKLEPKMFKKIALRYTFYFPDKRMRDIGNYEKAVSDYLVAQNFIEDDSWSCLSQLTLVFGGIDKNSRVEVGIDDHKS